MTRAGVSAVEFLVAGHPGVEGSAEPKVTYIGLGRYSCSGTASECTQINFNNAHVEEVNR